MVYLSSRCILSWSFLPLPCFLELCSWSSWPFCMEGPDSMRVCVSCCFDRPSHEFTWCNHEYNCLKAMYCEYINCSNRGCPWWDSRTCKKWQQGPVMHDLATAAWRNQIAFGPKPQKADYAQQLGLNIPWVNKLEIKCENFNTIGEFLSDIVCKLTSCVKIFAPYF